MYTEKFIMIIKTRSPFSRKQTTRKQDTDKLCSSSDLDLNPMTLIHLEDLAAHQK